MEITPDKIVYWSRDWGQINATLAFTWGIMILLTVGSWLITRKLSSGPEISRGQNLLEVLVGGIRDQIREVTQQDPGPYLSFIGTIFIFLLVSNLLTIVPFYIAPTASLSTTSALAICVFVAVPVYGIAHRGVKGYLKNYIEPTVFMLPFNIVGEVSRTIALAFRLYGNIMSGTMIIGILLALTPLFFPIVMQALGLITGVIQAYIFAILAMVYISANTRAHREKVEDSDETENSSTEE